ncbi:hypothetical protein [Crenobacter cavernae]|uniref:Helix-turn-helix domain-containing protein n=1 Tax=Crenobacter cavernae TaxID=2290923 RepID=A0ABY0FF75_9NEIS|nr:hypothetical protein [Crenobacter cavernae]RXZ43125.1 hypothetical protein EBB06_10920 [Crenobacter cavernae]
MKSGAITETRRVWRAEQAAFVAAPTTAKPAAFIKGPLPLEWMKCAGRLPGKTLQVGLLLWYLAGLKKTRTVRLGSKILAEMGVSRDAKYDALARLREAGLIAVEQRPGQAPWVTLLEPPPTNPQQENGRPTPPVQ